MKTPPEYDRLVQRMQNGILCADGFLGTDKRNLDEIISADCKKAESLGYTHAQIGESLRKIFQQVSDGFGMPVKIAEGVEGIFYEAMGRIPCPWADGVHTKGQAEIIDSNTHRKFVITALGIHMIEQHGFYQGKGSPYRLEPAELIELIKQTEK